MHCADNMGAIDALDRCLRCIREEVGIGRGTVRAKKLVLFKFLFDCPDFAFSRLRAGAMPGLLVGLEHSYGLCNYAVECSGSR